MDPPVVLIRAPFIENNHVVARCGVVIYLIQDEHFQSFDNQAYMSVCNRNAAATKLGNECFVFTICLESGIYEQAFFF
jgi:hypothetical protein